MKLIRFICAAIALFAFISCENPLLKELLPQKPETPEGISITYNANGGDTNAVPNKIDAEAEEKEIPDPDNPGEMITVTIYTIKAPDPPFENPTRKGYTFTGWQDGNGDNFSNTFPKDITESITVYAQWNPINYSITLTSTGATGDDNVTFCDPDDPTSTISSPISGVHHGEKVTIAYVLDDADVYNHLAFTIAGVNISQVNAAGSGTIDYTINADDAAGTTINITAEFSHSDE